MRKKSFSHVQPDAAEEEKTKQSSICVHKYSAHAKERQQAGEEEEEQDDEEEELVKQGRQ